MTCDDVRTRLTAYLDGDLDPDRGTVVRGHLRTCEACRVVATQEATLRDSLRALPTVDPPSTMWAGIQAQLAAAEVAESQRPAWKRVLARWAPAVPRFAMGGALAVTAVSILWWRAHRGDEPVVSKVADVPSPKIEAARHVQIAPAPTPVVVHGCSVDGAPDLDVTADLAAEAARITACYAQTGSELAALASEARTQWTDAERATFDARVAELRAAIDAAPEGRARQRAWRAYNRYVQNVVTRDDVALASGAVR
ncbi:MAG TPA: zf-HC2 domain-containing protein [Kofleriaceae bacterium]|nr:zf-HC2 domain-containing protein [Kofleriaceae bacterium]